MKIFVDILSKYCENDREISLPTPGWYWAPTGARIPAPRRCRYCAWSSSGGLGQPQPDNREQRQGGEDEACVAVLNNFYQVTLHNYINIKNYIIRSIFIISFIYYFDCEDSISTSTAH